MFTTAPKYKTEIINLYKSKFIWKLIINIYPKYNVYSYANDLFRTVVRIFPKAFYLCSLRSLISDQVVCACAYQIVEQNVVFVGFLPFDVVLHNSRCVD